LVTSPDIHIDGFLCPGHVTTIIGDEPYQQVARDFRIPCVVSGSEPVDILQSILLLVRQIENGEAKVEIQYQRGASPEGNRKARSLMEEVFRTRDSEWRGFGVLPGSGLQIAEPYCDFDTESRYVISAAEEHEPKGCLCGEIVRGTKRPPDCPLFRRSCSPDRPVGACMVSSEGTCAAYYRYAA
jgi:hydrogenase expression/formation protein HypD